MYVESKKLKSMLCFRGKITVKTKNKVDLFMYTHLIILMSSNPRIKRTVVNLTVNHKSFKRIAINKVQSIHSFEGFSLIANEYNDVLTRIIGGLRSVEAHALGKIWGVLKEREREGKKR